MRRWVAGLGLAASLVCATGVPSEASRTPPEVTTTVRLAPAPRALYVSHRVLEMTRRVHDCEEPVWNVNGPLYFGGLGWLWATWQAFRRADFPRNMAFASVREQSWAMARFAQRYGWPDQRGCSGGY